MVLWAGVIQIIMQNVIIVPLSKNPICKVLDV